MTVKVKEEATITCGRCRHPHHPNAICDQIEAGDECLCDSRAFKRFVVSVVVLARDVREAKATVTSRMPPGYIEVTAEEE